MKQNTTKQPLEDSKEGLHTQGEEFPIQDEIWPSRRWNEARTNYIDLSGSDFSVKAVYWGETITISNQEGFLCYVNPRGNYDAGVPSMEDRAIAKQICDSVNERKALLDSHKELLENLERILDRIGENGYQHDFPSAYERAIIALNNAKNI